MCGREGMFEVYVDTKCLKSQTVAQLWTILRRESVFVSDADKPMYMNEKGELIKRYLMTAIEAVRFVQSFSDMRLSDTPSQRAFASWRRCTPPAPVYDEGRARVLRNMR
ncbi:MAG: hypothetical protein CMM02_08120 [Rhodopirellula sp.]|nr:hypothetical protein [Rhodopirellula sp.]MAT10959.1 hypothetical protein [Rhodopirellula sp.]